MKRSDEGRRVALRKKKSRSSPLQGGTTTPRGYCWGHHLRPSTEGLRTGGVKAESVINHVFACQAKSRSPLRSEWLRRHLRRPRAKASCEAMRREAKWHLQNGGSSSEGLVRSPAKSCEAVPPERLHRQHRRPSGQMMTSDSGPRNSRGIQL